MDFNAAMARAAEAEADGDDVAADNMRNAIRQQDENIKAAAGRDSEREDWLRQIDVQYINKCSDVEELHKISQAMQDEGFAGLKKCADERLTEFVKISEQAIDMDALLGDLNDWEMVATRQDNELREASAAEAAEAAADGGGEGPAPIRRGADPTVKPAEPSFVP